MQIKTFWGSSEREARAEIERCLSADFAPGLCLLFASPNLPYASLAKFLAAKGMRVIGCTTAGEIIDGQVEEQTMVGMMFELRSDCFQILLEEQEAGMTEYACAQALGRRVKEVFASPAVILLTSGLTTDGHQLTEGLQHALGPAVPISGGMAGDDLHMQDTFVFTHERVCRRGLALLVFDREQVGLYDMASSGWQAVGVQKTVTRSEGNRVYTIDGEPTLDVYQKYFGLSDANLDKTAIEIGIHYPLQLQREEGAAVLRAPLVGNLEDRSVTFAGTVPEGATVSLSISAGAEITRNLLADYGELKRAQPNADAVILFSCIGRNNALGPMIEDEVAGIQALWQAPMVGLFTYGEIGRLNHDGCAFHNETCVAVVLKGLPEMS